ncbi:hypothetical protein HYR69_06345 [Candidatus Sumerlaeota bacterium]|nr:hypothetical protein [Candidatus Sumerlaeota bacterium]
MQRLLKNAPKDSCETLWAEDARAAMSNIPKWEPDVIFYDPRNRGLDGIAFVQSLKIKKLAANCDIAFIGKEFFKAEIEFSRQALGRNVIKLDLHEAMVAEQINEVLSQSRSRMKDKHHDLSEIEAEQKQQLAQAQAQRHQIARQREYFRERFGNIQQFIDDQLKKP